MVIYYVKYSIKHILNFKDNLLDIALVHNEKLMDKILRYLSHYYTFYVDLYNISYIYLPNRNLLNISYEDLLCYLIECFMVLCRDGHIPLNGVILVFILIDRLFFLGLLRFVFGFLRGVGLEVSLLSSSLESYC